MNPNDDARNVSTWLHEYAAHRVPAHLDVVLRETSARRQRPAWTIPERWLPVDLTSRAGTLAPPRLARAIVIALLVLAFVALAIIAVGSRQQRVPPPFGPARNGALLASADGDIFSVDPKSAASTPLITGDTFDFGPGFSRDGTMVSFLRAAPADCGRSDCGLILMVANADGTGIRALTPALQGLDALDWSPDGTRIAIVSFSDASEDHVLDIVNVDGSGMRRLDVGRPVHLPTWLPPDGREIVVQGEGDSSPGIFAVRADGREVRELTTRTPFDANDFKDSGVAPDGTRIGYRGDDGPGGRFRSHILDLRTGQDQVLPQPPEAAAQSAPLFSPDGQTVLYVRFYQDHTEQLVAAPADGTDVGLAVGPRVTFREDGQNINNVLFTPDGKAVLANYDAEQAARLVPIDGSPSTVLIRGELALPAYQRLAP
jgi:Tol biopolymer transport system component